MKLAVIYQSSTNLTVRPENNRRLNSKGVTLSDMQFLVKQASFFLFIKQIQAVPNENESCAKNINFLV